MLTLLMGKEKGGVKERAGAGESRGRGVWVVPVLNEEAPEPFSLLSKSTPLSARDREKESAHSGFYQDVFTGLRSPPLAGTPLEAVCVSEASGGHTMGRSACGNWAVVLPTGGGGREATGAQS